MHAGAKLRVGVEGLKGAETLNIFKIGRYPRMCEFRNSAIFICTLEKTPWGTGPWPEGPKEVFAPTSLFGSPFSRAKPVQRDRASRNSVRISRIWAERFTALHPRRRTDCARLGEPREVVINTAKSIGEYLDQVHSGPSSGWPASHDAGHPDEDHKRQHSAHDVDLNAIN